MRKTARGEPCRAGRAGHRCRGRGIGRELALALAGEGAAVGLVGRSRGPLDAVLREVAAAGGRAVAVPADVTQRDQVRAAVDTVTRDLGPVDLLVSNAGLRGAGARAAVAGRPGRLVAGGRDQPARPVPARPRGAAGDGGPRLRAGAAPRQRDGAHAAAGVVGLRRRRRPALGRLTDTLAAALEGTGVVVLEASPGLVRTDMTETMWGPPDEQPWNPVERDSRRSCVRFARGDLDALHGRFVHAARDDLDALLAAAGADRGPGRPHACGCGRTATTTRSAESRSHQDRRVAGGRRGLLQQDLLGPSVEGVRLGRAVADGGQTDPAVLGEAADHVEDDAGLPGLVEVQPVARHDVEQVLEAETAQRRRLEMVGRDEVLLLRRPAS